MLDAPQPVLGFAQTGLSPEILAILDKEGLVTPTPIQAEAIPVALKGGDLIGIAQTGTGKTLAFSLPTIDFLSKNKGTAVVLVPTRELALQVEESIRRVSNFMPNLRTICLIGGMPMYRQLQALRTGPRIMIATPGRLNDHLERGTIRLDSVKVIILDEADRMLDMGFAPQIEQIMDHVPAERQTLMFSATMAPAVSRLVAGYTKTPARIEVAKAGSSNALIRQEVLYIAPARKTEMLVKLLGEHEGPVLVFTRTKAGATNLMSDMRTSGHTSAEIHGDRSLRERREALDGFKTGKYRVLIATDIAARGIDVSNIAVVVNYDLPDDPDDYIHRIGRTGRNGSTGLSISFATRSQVRSVRTIEGLAKKQMEVSKHSEQAPQQQSYNRNTDSRPRQGGYSSSRYNGGGSGGPRRQGAPTSGKRLFGPQVRSSSW